MKKNVFVIAILLFLLLLNSGCLKDKTTTETGASELIVTMRGFENFMDNSSMGTNNATKYEYFNLTQADAGDIVILRDEISNVSYNATYNYTRVTFVTDLNHSMPFGGDLTQKFAAGDNVEVKFHVVNDVFTDPNNPSWTVVLETVKELWDSFNHRFTIIDPDLIQKV